MAGAVLTVGAVVTCPHAGLVTLSVSPSPRFSINGSAVVLNRGAMPVQGCPGVPGEEPDPCVLVEWQANPTGLHVDGVEVLTAGSVGLVVAASGAARGPAVVVDAQQHRVTA